MKSIIRRIAWLLSLWLAGAAAARTWTEAATGKTLEADFAGMAGAEVRLKLPGGRLAQVAVNKLCIDDQLFVRELVTGVSGAAWPQWRGANQDGVAPDSSLNPKWPPQGPVRRWSYDRAGTGYSGLTLVDGRLYTMGTRDGVLLAVALNLQNGWEAYTTELGRDDGQGYEGRWGSGPRSTPTYADGKLYCLGPTGGLHCLEAKTGRKLWERNLRQDDAGLPGVYGYAESPLVHGNRVLVSPGGAANTVVALDAGTGRVIWRAQIPGAGEAGCATAALARIGGTMQYVKPFAQLLAGVSVDSGEVVWTTKWAPGSVGAMPLVSEDGVFVTSIGKGGSSLFRIAGREVTPVWSSPYLTSHYMGAIKRGEFLFGHSSEAGLVCLDWKTGALRWENKGPGDRLRDGSVLAVGDWMISLNEPDGAVTLVEARAEGMEVKGQFRFNPPKEPSRPAGVRVCTPPVVLDGRLYLRDQGTISCYGVKG